MQERQTQVLALPARLEGSDRETEGILNRAPLRGSPGAHGNNPRYSQKFPAVPCRVWRHRSMPDTGGAPRLGKGMLLSISLSDGLIQAPASERPPSLAGLFSLFHFWSFSLSLSLSPFPPLSHFSLPLRPSQSVVTLFHEGKEGEVSLGLYFSPSHFSFFLK